MRFERALVITIVAGLACAGAVHGQFSQYTQPGTPNPGVEGVTREQMETAVAEARWRLGGLRIDPWLALRNVSWTDNPTGTPEGSETVESDVYAIGGAGFRAYLPTGPDVTWSVYALPEYVWWDEQEDRRRLNGRYGAGVFAFFNRLSVQASGTLAEELRILSSEFPVEANTRRTEGSISTSLRLGFSTALFAEAASSSIENLLEEEERATGPPLELLNRDERRVRGGLVYRPRPRWEIRAGAEWTEAELDEGSRDLSNSGTAPLLGIRYEGPKFHAQAEVQQRSLEAEPGSEFVDTDVTTYSGQIGIDGNRLSVSVYGRRELSLAVTEGYTHFENELAGVLASLRLGRRTTIQAFAESGTADFRSLDGSAPDREDDITAYGGEITMQLWRSASFHAGATEHDFDSNLPGADRSLTTIRAGISFGIGGDSPWV